MFLNKKLKECTENIDLKFDSQHYIVYDAYLQTMSIAHINIFSSRYLYYVFTYDFTQIPSYVT